MNGPRPRPQGPLFPGFSMRHSISTTHAAAITRTYTRIIQMSTQGGTRVGKPERGIIARASHYGSHIVLCLDRPARIRTATAAAERGSQRISQPYRDAHMQLTSIAKSAQGGTAGLALDRPQVPEPGPSSTAMTRHAAHDAPFPFLLWHSRCQDASVMAAHTRLRTVCCRRAAVSR